MRAGTALIATVAALAAACLDAGARASVVAAAVGGHVLVTRRLSGIQRFAGWTAAILGPLAVVHGLLNPAYAISGTLGGVVPYRLEGVAFAVRQAGLLAALLLPALYWLSVPREGIVAALARLPLAPSVAASAFDAVAMSVDLERRARLILDAQRARGIEVGPLWRRGVAMLALVIPLVATLLRDAPLKARLQHELRTSEAAFADGRAVPIWSAAEALVLTAALAAAVAVAFSV